MFSKYFCLLVCCLIISINPACAIQMGLENNIAYDNYNGALENNIAYHDYNDTVEKIIIPTSYTDDLEQLHPKKDNYNTKIYGETFYTNVFLTLISYPIIKGATVLIIQAITAVKAANAIRSVAQLNTLAANGLVGNAIAKDVFALKAIAGSTYLAEAIAEDSLISNVFALDVLAVHRSILEDIAVRAIAAEIPAARSLLVRAIAANNLAIRAIKANIIAIANIHTSAHIFIIDLLELELPFIDMMLTNY